MNRARLLVLKEELREERISYGELAEIEEAYEALGKSANGVMASDMINEIEKEQQQMSNIPTNSQHPAVTAHKRALMAARGWLHREGFGGAYGGNDEQVAKAMERYYTGGLTEFKRELFAQ